MLCHFFIFMGNKLDMKNKKTPPNRLITTMDQSVYAFPMLLEEQQKSELINGIFAFVEQLAQPEIDRILDEYPELLQQYDLKQLLSGEAEIAGINRQDLITAGLVSCLLSLIAFTSELTDDENRIVSLSSIEEDDIAVESIRYIISCISLKDFLKHLLLTVISITGADYYIKFQQKIKSENFETKDLLKLEQDEEIRKHLDLLLWFALIRLFLESVYFYFNDPNPEKKLS